MDLAQDLHHGELDVGRGEGLAVMPGDALLQIEGHRLTILADLEAFGERGNRV